MIMIYIFKFMYNIFRYEIIFRIFILILYFFSDILYYLLLFIRGISLFYNYNKFDLNEKKFVMVNDKREFVMFFVCVCR